MGCGGSIAKYSQQGHTTITVYVTSGEAGSHTYSRDELATKRENEDRQASFLLKVNETIFLKNLDGYLAYNRDNLVKIVSLLRAKKTDIIYLPHCLDGNEDHRITHKLVLDACRRSRSPWF